MLWCSTHTPRSSPATSPQIHASHTPPHIYLLILFIIRYVLCDPEIDSKWAICALNPLSLYIFLARYTSASIVNACATAGREFIYIFMYNIWTKQFESVDLN